jgi:hypothetical protein
MKTRVALLLMWAGLSVWTVARGAEPVRLAILDDRVRVEVGGKLFTEYIYKGGPRPYLYPVLAADGTRLNRDFPQAKIEGEETDHPHHTSLWFTHGAVNGVDFWSVGPKMGKIVNGSVKTASKGDVAVITAQNRWMAPDGSAFCTDETSIRIRAVPDGRLLDYEVTLKAPADRPVVFGDTKEGSMALRLAQWMTAPHKGRQDSNGQIVNSAGVRQGETWGKKADWVDYHAEKDGKIYGVAMFDHPMNPRHPTWWHVRDYGLFAANPFGQHDFESTKEKKVAAGTGDFTIPAGSTATFRWRFYFHMGDEHAAQVAAHYSEYAAGK